jgi:hypothetical protein
MDPEEERQNDDYSLPARRQNDLLRLVHSRGQVMVNDLAEHFEVSADTTAGTSTHWRYEDCLLELTEELFRLSSL